MEVKELRIGNYVKYNGSVVSVYAISNPMPSKDKHFDNKAKITLWCNGLIDATIDEIEPIPITDELLPKIGFRKNSFGWWRLDKRNDKFMIKSYSQIRTIEYWNEVHNPEDVTEVNYGSTIELPCKIHLHTFQNIWHLLSGEELEIKL